MTWPFTALFQTATILDFPDEEGARGVLREYVVIFVVLTDGWRGCIPRLVVCLSVEVDQIG